MVGRVKLNSVDFNNSVACAQTPRPAHHDDDDCDDGFDDFDDDGDDDGGDGGNWYLPAGLSGRTFLMKIPITLCCCSSTFDDYEHDDDIKDNDHDDDDDDNDSDLATNDGYSQGLAGLPG